MEQGGCCLTQQRALPSKADRFMSRYRPIAPKPRTLTMPSIPDINRPFSSSNSLDTTGCRSVPHTFKSRRLRKRRGDSLTPPQISKKAAASSGRSDCSKEQSSVSTCAAGSGFTVPTVVEVGRAGLGRLSAGCLFAANGSTSITIANGEMSDASVLAGAYVVAESGAIDTKSGIIGSNQSMLQDTGFMKRAAARTPASILPERGIATLCSGGFTEMIRGITGLPTTTDVANLMHPLGPTLSTVRSNSTNFGRECFTFSGVPSSCVALVEGENKMAVVELQQQQDRDANNKMVTLSLLPGPSSRSDFSRSSISTGSSLTQFPDLNTRHENGIRDARFRPLSDEPRACSSEEYDYPKSSLCDIALIRQVYGTSQEPVILVGDSRNVLWCNRAYERAFKESMDRQPRKTPRVVPFIDPLGIPTELGKFNVQLPGCGSYCATLWGFLKKFVVNSGTEAQDTHSPVEFSPKELKPNNPPDVCCRLGNGSGNPDREGCCNSGVIVPQPVRLVGSTVSLESVTDIHKEAQRLSDSLELVKKELEEGNLPAFITDSSNKVRWVNTAYKQMIGQPECSWLVSTVNTTEMPGILPSPRLVGEILFTNSVEIPIEAPAFSGRANIQWMTTGERKCMTVPCDVCRLESCRSGANALSLVWKFDIDASLRLTCGR